MPSSLYQRYRPKKWADLADQNHVKVTLQHEIEREQIAHAYLFVGPRGVGKTTTARLFAKAINCDARAKKTAEPCNSCASCKRIDAQQSFDLIEIDAASHTGVDHVREYILSSAEVQAGHGRYRVFIIDEAHMLSTAAFNAMLKILEEPPAHVIFILATTEAHKVPATIISRCQRFDFKRIAPDIIRDRLRSLAEQEGVQVTDDVLAAIAAHAEGSLRDAEGSLGQVFSIGAKKITMDEASLVIPRSTITDAAALVDLCLRQLTAEAIAYVNDRVDNGININVFMADVIVWLRTLLLAKVGKQLDLFSQQTLGELHSAALEQAARTTVKRLQMMIDIFIKQRSLLGQTPIEQLPCELAVVEACAITEGEGAEKIFNIKDSNNKQKPDSSATQKSDKPDETDSETEVKSSLSSLEKFTLEEVKGRWHEVLENIKSLNRSLCYVLAGSSPRAVSGNRIELGVKYPFHQDRVHDAKNRSVLAEATEKVFGQALSVVAVLNKDGE
ncbi:MAG: DNA polymerase III subunit gamma/tau [Patescibacteria group bacterium]|jgi:DNA polymerase-3 subunit gamma/tau